MAKEIKYGAEARKALETGVSFFEKLRNSQSNSKWLLS